MSRPFNIIWKYQNDEEILQTSIWYFDPGSPVVLDPEDLSDLSAIVKQVISDELDLILAEDVYSHSVTVTSPGAGTSGPGRFINAHAFAFAGPGPGKVMDSMVANVTLRGENAAGESVAGGMRISGLPLAAIDKNQLEAGVSSGLKDALELIYPPVIDLNGRNIERAIRSVRNEQPPEYVFPTTLEVSPRIGSRLDRVGNRPQRNTGPAEVVP